MSVFRRKKSTQWQRAAGKVGGAVGAVSSSPVVKAAVGALAGVTTLTAASAAVSATRRKSES